MVEAGRAGHALLSSHTQCDEYVMCVRLSVWVVRLTRGAPNIVQHSLSCVAATGVRRRGAAGLSAQPPKCS